MTPMYFFIVGEREESFATVQRAFDAAYDGDKVYVVLTETGSRFRVQRP